MRRNLMQSLILASAVLLTMVCGSCSGGKKNAAQAIVVKSDYSQAKIGDCFYSDGTFSTGQDSTKTCIGIVFSLKTSDEEKAQGWSHGQIVALANAGASEPVEWGLDGKELTKPFGKYSWKNFTAVREVINGYACSHSSLVSGADYKAFGIIAKFPVALPKATSGWYLPSVGQWIQIIENLGKVKIDPKGTFDLNMALGNMTELNLKQAAYWTSTAVDKDMAWYVDLQDGSLTGDTKETRNKVRAVAAF